MNNRMKAIVMLMGASLLTSVIWAEENPYHDPRSREAGYGLKKDYRPWFDGVPLDFYQEMFDGKWVKPQEQGTYQTFPEDSVPVKMVLGKIVRVYDPFIPLTTGERETKPENQTSVSPESLERGRLLYNTYCAVCHGKDGNAGTPVAQKGMMAGMVPPPIKMMVPIFSEAHLYNKIRYGSKPAGIMPAYGAQTSRQDRWDMVNYMKSPEFGKESN